MPNPSELARRDEEDRPLPKAETFDITIDFGPHQAKVSIPRGEFDTDKASLVLAENLKPHVSAMLKAEEANHG